MIDKPQVFLSYNGALLTTFDVRASTTTYLYTFFSFYGSNIGMYFYKSNRNALKKSRKFQDFLSTLLINNQLLSLSRMGSGLLLLFVTIHCCCVWRTDARIEGLPQDQTHHRSLYRQDCQKSFPIRIGCRIWICQFSVWHWLYFRKSTYRNLWDVFFLLW